MRAFNPRRVTIVTSGHPSSCPRMVKAADAAVEAGFAVRVVSVDSVEWAAALDGDLVARRRWQWSPVRIRAAEHPLASRWVSARHRAARAVAARATPARMPMSAIARAYARTHPELMTAILAEPFDFVYGGTVGGLAATAEAARRARRPFALDFEDYHRGESEAQDAELTHGLAALVVNFAHRGAAFLSTSSIPMAERYEADLARPLLVTHNVVPRPPVAPAAAVGDGPLKLYWFSQTIGAGRGLEDIVAGAAAASIPAELHLRGSGSEHVERLRRLAGDLGAQLSIVHHDPAPADQMVTLCREHAIGLSPEHRSVINRDLCVTNKILTYFAAGLAVVATDTSGHRSIAQQASAAMALYPPGDVHSLAGILRRWNDDRARLVAAREASWRAAEHRFHWEHPSERGALLDAITQAVA